MMNDVALSKNIPRLIKAVELMTAEKGVTIDELEQALNIKRRSVYRLIKTLEDRLHFPVSSKREGFGGVVKYRLPGNYLAKLNKMAVPRISLSKNEVRLMQFFLAHDTVFQGTQIYEDAQMLKRKLQNFLPKKTKAASSNWTSSTIFAMPHNAVKSYKGKEHIIYTLIEAASNTISCNITYNVFKKDPPKTYAIDPLKFIHHRGGLYIIVRIPKHDNIIALAIERIETIEVSSKTFIPVEDDKINSLLNLAFDLTFDDLDLIRAVIHFTPRVAPYIAERRWSGRQELELHKDGSCTLTITTIGKIDLISWLLSWGPDARVISPDFFRRQIEEKIKAMHAVYNTSVEESKKK
jgi:predicted DNA-binding transcriptional regulator YafY